MNKMLSAVLIGSVIAVTTYAGSASAQTAAPAAHWKKDHPRRAQVNARLKNQNHRITKEVKEGEINKTQAHALRTEDHQIRQEERDMAAQNGGHITKGEQRTLNQQENKVSKQIGQ